MVEDLDAPRGAQSEPSLEVRESKLYARLIAYAGEDRCTRRAALPEPCHTARY